MNYLNEIKKITENAKLKNKIKDYFIKNGFKVKNNGILTIG